MTAATIYCRISLDRKGEMLGVERQETACRDFVERQGWTVREVIVDNDISAFSGKRRPGFEHLLETEPEAVVVWHLDRLLRLSRELERVIDLRVNVYALHAGHLDLSTPAGRAVAKTVTAWSQYEAEQKAIRQKAAHVQRAEMGKPWWTRRPFGYEKDGTLRHEESDALEIAYADFIARRVTLSEIARRWNAANLLTTKGNQWNQSKVRQVMISPRNASIRVQYQVVVGPGNWEPVVADETYAAACVVMNEPHRKLGGGGRRKGMLVGVATCGRCGAAVRQGAVGRPGNYRKVYVCTQNQCTTHPLEEVDRYVGLSMTKLLSDPERMGDLMPTGEDSRELLASRAALAVTMTQVGEDYADGLMDREEFRTLRKRQQERMADLDERIVKALSGTALGHLPLAQMAEGWFDESKVSVSDRRAAIEGLCTVTLMPRRKGERTYEPSQSIVIENVVLL